MNVFDRTSFLNVSSDSYIIPSRSCNAHVNGPKQFRAVRFDALRTNSGKHLCLHVMSKTKDQPYFYELQSRSI
jgi:hypothetical protein